MFKLFDVYLDKAERGFNACQLSQIYIGMLFVIGVICFLALIFPLFIIGIVFGKVKS